MSSPSIDELDQHFRALKREIRQSFPSEDGPPSPKVRLLVEVLKHVNTKAKQVWSVRRQNRLRPDRHYNVGFALKCDLEILDHYLRIDGQFSTSTVETWAVGLIAPLNEAILQSEDGKAKLYVSQLVQGLPKELEDKCSKLSLAQVASAREEMSRILAHNISSAVRIILKITDHKTMPSFFTEPVHQLAEDLLRELDTLEHVERFDIAVTPADFESFRGSKPAGLTTYASWILDALYFVGHSLRPDPTALGQDKQVIKWCDRCREIVAFGLKEWYTLLPQHPEWSRKKAIYDVRRIDSGHFEE